MSKEKRPSIPIKTVIKLWIAAGGRCEFPGCNKPLWRDDLTMEEMNRANIAHIISWTPNGPRGDAMKSPKLAKDFNNLTLVCLDHGKLIDDEERVKEYTVERLGAFKNDHENRIYRQTSRQDDYKTTILRFIANIGERKTNIPFPEIIKAISFAQKYPEDDKGIEINLGSIEGDGDENYWKVVSEQIKNRVQKELTNRVDGKLLDHLSIFAIAPIPLLVQLGASIGNCLSFDLYQHHRDTDNWVWNSEDKSWKGYVVKTKTIDKESNEIALVLSLSGKIHYSEVTNIVKVGTIYEMTVENPQPMFLKTKKPLEDFKSEYRKIISKIREDHGNDCQIHLFPAIPAPIAILCGSELLLKTDPPLLVYDNKGKFRFCSKII